MCEHFLKWLDRNFGEGERGEGKGITAVGPGQKGRINHSLSAHLFILDEWVTVPSVLSFPELP